MKRAAEERMMMCLCGACACAFYNTPGNKIKRKNTKQQRRDICDFCNYRYGFDYLVKFGSGDLRNSGKMQNRTLESRNRTGYSQDVSRKTTVVPAGRGI